MNQATQEATQKLKGYNKQHVNVLYHRKGWTMFQAANRFVHNKTSVVYEALLTLWNDRGFPNQVWFTKRILEGLNSNVVMSDGQYAAIMKELQEKGLVSYYVPGSNTGKLHHSVVQMVNLTSYYNDNKDPKPDQAPQAPAPIKSESPLAEMIKKSVPTPVEAQTPPPVEEPKKIQIGESDIVDAAKDLAAKSMELYKAIHNESIEHGLSKEAEIYTSFQLASFIAKQEGATNLPQLNTDIEDKLSGKIDENGMLFAASQVEIMFLKHASGKHGVKEMGALRAAFRQKIETQQKSYIQMVGAVMSQTGLSHWCDMYHILGAANNILYRIATDPKITADEMNPYLIATYKWRKYAEDRQKEKAGKQMPGKKKKNMRKPFEQD